MNHLLSFGVDVKWRRDTVSEILKMSKGRKNLQVLDIATGTGDLAISLSEAFKKGNINAQITAMDFNDDMLLLADRKSRKSGTDILFEHGDAVRMKYGAGSFDVLTSGFALRNFDDLVRFAEESHRVLKKGGFFVFVDMAMPDEKAKQYFFKIYSLYMRLLGFFVDNESYKWLVHSIKAFDKKALEKKLRVAGFRNVRQRELSSGIGYIILGEKR